MPASTTHPPARAAASKLLVGATVAMLLVVGAVGAAWTNLRPALQGIAGLQRDVLPKVVLVQRAFAADLKASVALRDAMLLTDTELTQLSLERFHLLDRAAARNLAEFERLATPLEATLLTPLLRAREDMNQARRRAIEAVRAAPAQTPPDAITNELQLRLGEYTERVQRLYESKAVLTEQQVADLNDSASDTQALLLVGLALGTLVLLGLGAAWQREHRLTLARKEHDIARLQAQRDALVREVHHRIKNHLQGLQGFMDSYRDRDDLSVPQLLQTLQSRVSALVNIHGLQSEGADDTISLTDLVARQVALTEQGFPRAKVAVHWQLDPADAFIAAQHAVPVALVVSELLTNALKHGWADEAEVQVRADAGMLEVCVANPVSSAEPADASAPTGHGLELARALAGSMGELRRGPARDGHFVMCLRMPAVPALAAEVA